MCSGYLDFYVARNRCRHAALPGCFLTVATDGGSANGRFSPCSESCSGVTRRLNNSTPIACSSARMRRLNAGCETLRLTAAREKLRHFSSGQKNHKAIWFQCYAKTAPQSSITLYSVSRPCGHSTSIRAADNRLCRFKRSFHAGFAVFDHQFAASVYLLNAQFRRHDQ